MSSNTIAPSDSASQGQRKKSRPGKAQRQAARSGNVPVATAETGVSSVADQAAFASRASSDPVPQPGRFPVVFQTGAGEPTRDVSFAYDPKSIKDVTTDLASRYTYNAKYAEFSTHSGYTDDLFEKDIVRSFLLGLAQQTVHSHVNMGLPQGDFSPLFSADVFSFSSIGSILSQFGEFAVPALGTRFLLSDYQTTVSSLIFAAKQISEDQPGGESAIGRLWLPMKVGDKRTRFILASGLNRYLLGLGIQLDYVALQEALLTERLDSFEAIKVLLGDDDDRRNRFDFLFSGFVDENAFVAKFSGDGPAGVLRELGLYWGKPNRSHLDFSFNAKSEFSELVDEWARKRGTITRFISCRSGLANRSAAHGSAAQLSSVSTVNSVTVVNSLVALSAPEFSLLSCFPPSGLFQFVGPFHVVLTTSIPVAVRATEFQQLDWLT